MITKRQRQVLIAIMELTEAQGYPPTIREIGTHLNLSSSATVYSHIQTLMKNGYVHHDSSPRTLRVIRDP